MTVSRIASRGIALFVSGLLLAPASPADEPTRPDYHIQVFALTGPVCPVTQEEAECPDALLPEAELVLQRIHRPTGTWEDITRFETNDQGYASLLVHRGGSYRITRPSDAPSLAPRSMLSRAFEGEVFFKVTARHYGPMKFANVTPVVVT